MVVRKDGSVGCDDEPASLGGVGLDNYYGWSRAFGEVGPVILGQSKLGRPKNHGEAQDQAVCG